MASRVLSRTAASVARGARRYHGQSRTTAPWPVRLNQSLEEVDPDMYDIIEHEKRRLYRGLELIPSENFASTSVMEAVGSVMTNKYSEGYPGARYYGGNEFIDKSEDLCRSRALEAFRLDPNDWGVNVQALSGSPANFHVYTAVLGPNGRLMGLDLPHGGHLSHGFEVANKKISATSIYFENMPYRLDESTGLIDYDTLAANALLFRPKVIVAGASAYSRNIDYKRMREIADSVGAYLMADMAHISGLVAADVTASPFDYADIVTTTTHKSLRGPRGAMIFFKKGVRSTTKKGKNIMYDLEEKINFSVFPGHQGGPHNHTIAGLAVALKQSMEPEFKLYQEQVLRNCKVLASELQGHGINLVSGGTDNHLLLADLRSTGVDGARVEHVLECAHVAVNKNTVPGDKSALLPSGLRLGTPALTSRGMVEDDFKTVAELLHRGIQTAATIKQGLSSKKLADFKSHVEANEIPEIDELRKDVEDFASQFPTIGYEQETMRYKD
eukprot:TRINITY_DN1702_c0_g1_i1.p1 TRINITY_DN1702_c0_g1~~TRINITY_DN1702_c0_g1_i1.p1  ORF type:complete len:499 (-),score=143.74 TRINITY_DN1702_c0_g1_i1:131-1627(-)